MKNKPTNSRSKASLPAEKQWIETVSTWMDTRFRIPFTDIRFGLDAVLGLVPYAGDVFSLLISSVLVVAMMRHGVSGRVVLRMLWNIVVDALLGAIPLLGDIFDVAYRANRRNFKLLREHYHEGKHQGSAWPFVILVLVILLALVVASWWLLFFLIDTMMGG